MEGAKETAKEASTSNNELHTIQFEGHMITLNEPTSGKINASFDDFEKRRSYEAHDVELKRVNYKTVVAGVKGTHPQIINAKLQLNQAGKYALKIIVTYEYLPEIVEEIVFQQREIPAAQSQEAMIRGMRTYVRGIRDQLAALGSVQVIQGPLDQTTDTQIFTKLSHKRTVFTWSLTFDKLSNNVIKPQMYYYNSVTKQRKTSGAIPEEGVYVHHIDKGYTEIRFYAELEDFDMVVFELKGKHNGEYTLSSQKVEVK